MYLLIVIPLSDMQIKNSVYTLEEILGDGELASKFSEGTCLVFRLTVDDYHRYHYLDSGCTMLNYKIPGELHTVRPIASKYKVFSRNCREVTYMNTYNFGEVVQVEVGATLVGCIKNKDNIYFNKLEEKGHFEYGCSTILLILNKDAMIDQDIVYHSKQGIETKVSIGDKIGYIERKN